MRLQKYGSSTLACSAHFLKYRLMRRCAPPSQNKKTDLKSIKILSLKKALPTGFDTEPNLYKKARRSEDQRAFLITITEEIIGSRLLLKW